MNAQRFFKLLLLIFLLLGLIVSQASAESDRVTQGEVEAVLNAFLTGGQQIFEVNNVSLFYAAPVDLFDGSIRPLPPWDGRHYCEEDWHVVLIGVIDGGDASYKLTDASTFLSPFTFTFILDDETLPTVRTPIKPHLDPAFLGVEKAYGLQEGAILSPEDLSVGEHSLIVQFDHPLLGAGELPVSFFTDPVDSETCNG